MKIHTRVFSVMLLTVMSFSVQAFGDEAFFTGGRLKVFWSCNYLGSDESATTASKNLKCEDLYSEFKDANKNSLEFVSRSEAEVVIELSNTRHPPAQMRYDLSFIPAAKYEMEKMVTPHLDADETIDLVNLKSMVQSRILTGLQQFTDIVQAATNEQGNIVVVGRPAGAGGAGTVAPAQLDKPWYVEASLQGGGNGSGDVKGMNVTNSYSLNYYSRNDKFRGTIAPTLLWFTQSIPVANGVDKGSIVLPLLNIQGIYSMNKNWNVAVISDSGFTKGTNIKRFEELTLGLEYILIPFRKTEKNQFIFRVGPKVSQVLLDKMNTSGNLKETLGAAFAQILYTNVFFEGNLGATLSSKVVTFPGRGASFNKYTGGLDLSVKVKKQVYITFKGSFTQMKDSFTYPDKNAIDYSHPAQLMFLGAMKDAPGKNYDFNVGIRWSFGPASKKAADQRWSQ